MTIDQTGMGGGRIRFGPAGWSYEDWGGIVYPRDKPAKFDQLFYMSSYFDTVEINSTFYRPPSRQVAASWARRVGHNRNFKFTVKLWQRFTHEQEPATINEERIFKEGLEPLLEAGVFGCLLIQFPWSFKNHPHNRERLGEVFKRFEGCSRALEVRHASWNVPPIYRFLKDQGVGFVNIDQPLIGRSSRPTDKVTAPVGYIRLHGRNYQDWFREDAGRDARYNYLYSEEELKPWTERISHVSSQAPETYVITNNHFRGQAVVNALQLKFMLTGQKVNAPELLVQHYPVLQNVVTEVDRRDEYTPRLF
ncbi:MAG: DUF72 domain-containing protein [Thermodesulfobacteriota bacterium]